MPLLEISLLSFTPNQLDIMGPINEAYRRLGLTEFTTADPTAEKPQPLTGGEKQFSVNLRYNEANPAPVTIRQQVARTTTSRSDIDYIFEVTFSGPDLSTATSCYKRLTHIMGKFTYEEVFGSQMVHSTYGTIEVPRPKRFEEKFKFYIVNSSKNFRIKTTGLRMAGPYVVDQLDFEIDHDVPDFTMEYEGKIQTQGRIAIHPLPDRPVCVCQLDYKSPFPV